MEAPQDQEGQGNRNVTGTIEGAQDGITEAVPDSGAGSGYAGKKRMTLAEAKLILRAPKFGDPQCLAAMKRLDDERKAEALRTKLIGKRIPCGACGGTGDRCGICAADGTVLITQEWAAKCDVDVLESMAEELGL